MIPLSQSTTEPVLAPSASIIKISQTQYLKNNRNLLFYSFGGEEVQNQGAKTVTVFQVSGLKTAGFSYYPPKSRETGGNFSPDSYKGINLINEGFALMT